MMLSVIIPVYKVEQTLDRCVESVLKQNVHDMEVILVDDGSPDCCSKMCDDWAKKDNRINVVHKKNGGLGDARNAGMGIATGEYITFVDSDDYLNDGIYQQMLDLIYRQGGVDMLEFSINCVGWEKEDISYSDHVYTDAMEYWRTTRAWNHAYACNKIFKRNVFGTLRFPTGNLYEDLLLQPAIIKRCRKIITSSVIGYNYCSNAMSITNAISSENLKQCLVAEQYVAKEMNAHWYKEWNLFMCMLYRQVDIYRLSGEIILTWPFVRLICWIHKHTKGRNK